jgi:hypothetical protein
MDPFQNRWLIVRKGVVLRPSISTVIVQLDGFFGKHAVRSYVTTGLRSAADQIRIILDAGFARGVPREWPELRGGTGDTLVMHAGQPTPLWYVVCGRLLTIGFLINPPVESKVPFDNVHPSGRSGIARRSCLFIYHWEKKNAAAQPPTSRPASPRRPSIVRSPTKQAHPCRY